MTEQLGFKVRNLRPSDVTQLLRQAWVQPSQDRMILWEAAHLCLNVSKPNFLQLLSSKERGNFGSPYAASLPQSGLVLQWEGSQPGVVEPSHCGSNTGCDAR
jgi:hypothetical protein